MLREWLIRICIAGQRAPSGKTASGQADSKQLQTNNY